MRATTVLTAVDAYPDQREIEVYNLGSALRSAVSAQFEDSRRVDFLFADMTEGMFDRGYIFTLT